MLEVAGILLLIWKWDGVKIITVTCDKMWYGIDNIATGTCIIKQQQT